MSQIHRIMLMLFVSGLMGMFHITNDIHGLFFTASLLAACFGFVGFCLDWPDDKTQGANNGQRENRTE